MRPRIFLLPVAAILIVALCAYKMTRTYPTREQTSATPFLMMPASPFELLDEQKPSRMVRLAAHLGRERVVIVFFDGNLGVHRSRVLQQLREDFNLLDNANVKILAISTALPQQNRKWIEDEGAFPFPILSDPGLEVHRDWGQVDATNQAPLTGVFLVDRAGNVRWSKQNNTPEPIAEAEQHPEQFVRRLVEGE